MPSIEEYRQLGNPIISGIFRVESLPSVIGYDIVGAGTRSSQSGDTVGRTGETLSGEDFLPLVKDASIPFSNTGSEAIYGGGTNAYYAFDLDDISKISLDFFVPEKRFADLMRYIFSWKALVFDPDTGLRGFPDDYKKSMRISLLGSYHEPMITYEFSGIFPTNTDEWPLSRMSTDPIGLKQEFSVDSGTVVYLRGGLPLRTVPLGQFSNIYGGQGEIQIPTSSPFQPFNPDSP